MVIEHQQFIKETNEEMVRVSPTTQALMRFLIAASKSRSRNFLIRACHQVIKRFSIIEFCNNLHGLIPDLQEIILKRIRVHDFTALYFEVASRSYKFYEIFDLWGQHMKFPRYSGVATMVINPNPIMNNGRMVAGYADEQMKAWKYGMIHGFYCIPFPGCYFYENHCTNFQKYIFNRAEKYRRRTGYLSLEVQCANIEVTTEKINPPHYLIILGTECKNLVDPICRRQRRVVNPVQARAIGFFYIAQYINQALELQKGENPPLIFRVGNTTVIAPQEMHAYYQKGIVHSESATWKMLKLENSCPLKEKTIY